MGKCYIELRQSAARGTDSIAADIMRHLHSRQHLGKTLIVCEQPHALLGASRKQWLKLSRTLQKMRAGTLNADKILKYTHTITHMQYMKFSGKTPLESPDADVYFLSPVELTVLPLHCLSVYILDPLPAPIAQDMIAQLPADTLIVDYQPSSATNWQALGLKTKKELEDQVDSEWRQVRTFMQSHNIAVEQLISDDMHDLDAMDDALDKLLADGRKFLHIADDFQRALELARPMRISKTKRAAYDSFALLAHRVQALSPGVFTQHFLEVYNEDDTFFLYDVRNGTFVSSGETLREAVARHLKAGRKHLALALRQAAER